MGIDRLILRMFAEHIEKISGIQLDESKSYLIETRLHPLLESLQYNGLAELYQAAKKDKSRRIDRMIIDRITTPETAFFRDPPVFEALRQKILPALVDRRMHGGSFPARIFIWSAGCSTGQEAYSIAITLHEALQHTKIDWAVLGTDISETAIERAEAGEYSPAELEKGLDPHRKTQYFEPTPKGGRIQDFIRTRITFRRHHLLEEPIESEGFDVVFCRNVAIYFRQETRERLIATLHGSISQGGYLVLGLSESLTEAQPFFESQRYASVLYYRKKRLASSSS